MLSGGCWNNDTARIDREYIHVKDAAKASVNVLANQYKNKHVNITGKKKIKVLAFLNKLSKMLGISSKINFQNKELTGHYVSTPNTYKLKNRNLTIGP